MIPGTRAVEVEFRNLAVALPAGFVETMVTRGAAAASR
jgi:hypothetical protein